MPSRNFDQLLDELSSPARELAAAMSRIAGERRDTVAAGEQVSVLVSLPDGRMVHVIRSIADGNLIGFQIDHGDGDPGNDVNKGTWFYQMPQFVQFMIETIPPPTPDQPREWVGFNPPPDA